MGKRGKIGICSTCIEPDLYTYTSMLTNVYSMFEVIPVIGRGVPRFPFACRPLLRVTSEGTPVSRLLEHSSYHDGGEGRVTWGCPDESHREV